MVGGRTERRPRRRTHAASVVVPFPLGDAGGRLALARLVPSGRSLLAGFGLFLCAIAAYWAALASSVFAVERVTVQGVSGLVAQEVERATSHLVGQSLVSLDTAEVEDSVRALPSVAGVSVDRAFPHALVVKVAAERPVVVVRQGSSSWLVGGSGKVIREIERGTERSLPRIWLGKDTPVAAGTTLPATLVPAARALAAARDVGLRRRVKAVRSSEAHLTLVLERGPELRLGEPSDVLLKLAVAARVLPQVDDGAVYLDVSVPERPVSSRYLNP